MLYNVPMQFFLFVWSYVVSFTLIILEWYYCVMEFPRNIIKLKKAKKQEPLVNTDVYNLPLD